MYRREAVHRLTNEAIPKVEGEMCEMVLSRTWGGERARGERRRTLENVSEIIAWRQAREYALSA